MRAIRGSELLLGSDHEFLVNLYTTVLNRWPDEGGYRHYLGRIEGQPDRRREIIEEIAASEEAQKLGIAIDFGDAGAAEAAPGMEAPEPETELMAAAAPAEEPPSEPAAAPQVAGEVTERLDALGREVEALRAGLAAGPPIDEDAAAVRLQRLETTLAETRSSLEQLQLYTTVVLKRFLCDYVNELLTVERANTENRIRVLEKRLLETDAGAAPPG